MADMIDEFYQPPSNSDIPKTIGLPNRAKHAPSSLQIAPLSLPSSSALSFFRTLSGYKIAEIVCLAFLAYAPWHDAYNLGFRPLTPYELGPLKAITWSGVFNALWIALGLAALIPLLIRSVRRQPLGWGEGMILSIPFLVALNTRVIDSQSVIVLENAALLSCLLALIPRRDQIFSESGHFRKWAPWVFLTSYALAVFLPMIIPRGDHQIFMYFYPVWRFVGWVGEGTAISLCGLTLVAFSSFRMTDELKTRPDPRALAACAAGIVLGFIGVYLNVMRIAMLALLVFALVMAWDGIRSRSRSRLAIFAVLSLACGISLMTGQFAIKSNFFWKREAPIAAVKRAGPVTVIEEETIGPDKILVTNGRTQLTLKLWENMEGSRLTGLGSGAAPRLLKEINSPIRQPQNDYLRILFEHGLVGLIFFLAALLMAFRNRISRPQLAVLSILGICMLTDNILVFPTFGYGPLLFAALMSPNRSA